MKDSNKRNEFFWILLVIASFILGRLFTETQYLRQKQGGSVATAAVPSPAVAAPSPAVAAAQVLPEAANVPKVTAADHLRGKASAVITLVEYSDMECPFCKRFHPTMQKILQDYKNEVNWVYRHFPLQFHANANTAALGAECAAEQGGNELFWEYVDGIFSQESLTANTITEVAKKIGLNQAKFESCFEKKSFQKLIDEQQAGGQSAGITGTPGTVLINNKTGKTQLIVGALPYEEIKKIIDTSLAKN